MRKNYTDFVKAVYGSATDIAKIAHYKRKASRIRSDPSQPTEWQLQCNLVQWARDLGLPLISIPNAGRRSYWTGQREVAAGLTKGVSDLFLAMPRAGLGGYWIEMKRPGKKPDTEQLAWLLNMRNQGYRAEWFDSWELARDSIIEYLG